MPDYFGVKDRSHRSKIAPLYARRIGTTQAEINDGASAMHKTWSFQGKPEIWEVVAGVNRLETFNWSVRKNFKVSLEQAHHLDLIAKGR
jgi:hypothetical protein